MNGADKKSDGVSLRQQRAPRYASDVHAQQFLCQDPDHEG